MSKRSRFRTHFGSQSVIGSQSLLKSARLHLSTILPIIWVKLSCKKLLLVRFEILGLLVETMTSNDKISRRNGDNSAQQVQMKLSQKPKTFSEFSFAFLKSISNFGYFPEKKSPIA